MRTLALRKALSIGLGLILFSQPAFNSLAEASIWEERRLAALPASAPNTSPLNPAHILKQMPTISGTLPTQNKLSPDISSKYDDLSESLQATLAAIPLTHSRIQKIHDSRKTTNAPIVLIQDIHLNAEAQNNIAAVLQSLIDHEAIQNVGVEGAFTKFDFSRFRFFDNKAVTKKVIQAYLNQNLLAAPSYVGITSLKEPPAFVGIDDKAHYDANVQAYRQSLVSRDQHQNWLSQEKTRISQAKQNSYSPPLQRFDVLHHQYQAKKLNLGSYAKVLATYETDVSLPLEQFLSAYEMETSLNFNVVESQRKKAIEKLTTLLSKDHLKTLLSQSLAYRTGRSSFGDFYSRLKTLFETHDVALKNYPAFDDYIRYVLLADGIEAEPLFKEINRIENLVYGRLAETEEEKELVAQSKRLSLTEKLLNFELTPLEWDEYRISKLDIRNLSSYERFYEEADIRSQKMVENLAGHVSKPQALIIGGFHTPLVSDLLREKGHSFVVVTPKVTKIDTAAGSSYLSVFAQDKTPLDRLFQGEKLFVSPSIGHITHPQTGAPVLTDVIAEQARANATVTTPPDTSATQVQPGLFQIIVDGVTRFVSFAGNVVGYVIKGQRPTGGHFVEKKDSLWVYIRDSIKEFFAAHRPDFVFLHGQNGKQLTPAEINQGLVGQVSFLLIGALGGVAFSLFTGIDAGSTGVLNQTFLILVVALGYIFGFVLGHTLYLKILYENFGWMRLTLDNQFDDDAREIIATINAGNLHDNEGENDLRIKIFAGNIQFMSDESLQLELLNHLIPMMHRLIPNTRITFIRHIMEDLEESLDQNILRQLVGTLSDPSLHEDADFFQIYMDALGWALAGLTGDPDDDLIQSGMTVLEAAFDNPTDRRGRGIAPPGAEYILENSPHTALRKRVFKNMIRLLQAKDQSTRQSTQEILWKGLHKDINAEFREEILQELNTLRQESPTDRDDHLVYLLAILLILVPEGETAEATIELVAEATRSPQDSIRKKSSYGLQVAVGHIKNPQHAEAWMKPTLPSLSSNDPNVLAKAIDNFRMTAKEFSDVAFIEEALLKILPNIEANTLHEDKDVRRESIRAIPELLPALVDLPQGSALIRRAMVALDQRMVSEQAFLTRLNILEAYRVLIPITPPGPLRQTAFRHMLDFLKIDTQTSRATDVMKEVLSKESDDVLLGEAVKAILQIIPEVERLTQTQLAKGLETILLKTRNSKILDEGINGLLDLALNPRPNDSTPSAEAGDSLFLILTKTKSRSRIVAASKRMLEGLKSSDPTVYYHAAQNMKHILELLLKNPLPIQRWIQKLLPFLRKVLPLNIIRWLEQDRHLREAVEGLLQRMDDTDLDTQQGALKALEHAITIGLPPTLLKSVTIRLIKKARPQYEDIRYSIEHVLDRVIFKDFDTSDGSPNLLWRTLIPQVTQDLDIHAALFETFLNNLERFHSGWRPTREGEEYTVLEVLEQIKDPAIRLLDLHVLLENLEHPNENVAEQVANILASALPLYADADFARHATETLYKLTLPGRYERFRGESQHLQNARVKALGVAAGLVPEDNPTRLKAVMSLSTVTGYSTEVDIGGSAIQAVKSLTGVSDSDDYGLSFAYNWVEQRTSPAFSYETTLEILESFPTDIRYPQNGNRQLFQVIEDKNSALDDVPLKLRAILQALIRTFSYDLWNARNIVDLVYESIEPQLQNGQYQKELRQILIQLFTAIESLGYYGNDIDKDKFKYFLETLARFSMLIQGQDDLKTRIITELSRRALFNPDADILDDTEAVARSIQNSHQRQLAVKRILATREMVNQIRETTDEGKINELSVDGVAQIIGQFILNDVYEMDPILMEVFDSLNIHFADGGNAWEIYSSITNGMLDAFDTPEFEPVELPDLSRLEYEERAVSLEDLLAENGFEGAEFMDEPLGRTIRFRNADGQILSIKLMRADEDPSILAREGFLMNWTDDNKKAMGLQSDYPRAAARNGKPLVYQLTGNIPDQIEQVVSALASGQVGTKNTGGLKINAGYKALVYMTPDEDYFDYLSRPDMEEEEFWTGMEKSMTDLMILARHGLIHKSLIDLFHNTNENREDLGRYLWMVDLVRTLGRSGSGRLHSFLEAVQYANLRKSGLADFGDIVTFDEIMRNTREHAPHLRTLDRFGEKAPQYYLTSLLGDYFLAAMLMMGPRIHRAGNTLWQDEKEIERMGDRMRNVFLESASAFTQDSEEDLAPLVDFSGDFTRLLRQMAFYMTNAYVPFVRPEKEGRPDIHEENIYREGTHVTIGDYRGTSWDRAMGWLGNAGDPHLALGPVNGQLPIKEIVRLNYLLIPQLIRKRGPPQEVAQPSASIKDAWAKGKFVDEDGNLTAGYYWYTIFGVNWEMVFQMPIAATQIALFFFPQQAWLQLIVYTMWAATSLAFGFAHTQDGEGNKLTVLQRLWLSVVGVGFGAPFVFLPMFFSSLGLFSLLIAVPISALFHSGYNFFKLRGWLSEWMSLASISGKKKSRGQRLLDDMIRKRNKLEQTLQPSRQEIFNYIDTNYPNSKFGGLLKRRLNGLGPKASLKEIETAILSLKGKFSNEVDNVVKALPTLGRRININFVNMVHDGNIDPTDIDSFSASHMHSYELPPKAVKAKQRGSETKVDRSEFWTTLLESSLGLIGSNDSALTHISGNDAFREVRGAIRRLMYFYRPDRQTNRDTRDFVLIPDDKVDVIELSREDQFEWMENKVVFLEQGDLHPFRRDGSRLDREMVIYIQPDPSIQILMHRLVENYSDRLAVIGIPRSHIKDFILYEFLIPVLLNLRDQTQLEMMFHQSQKHLKENQTDVREVSLLHFGGALHYESLLALGSWGQSEDSRIQFSRQDDPRFPLLTQDDVPENIFVNHFVDIANNTVVRDNDVSFNDLAFFDSLFKDFIGAKQKSIVVDAIFRRFSQANQQDPNGGVTGIVQTDVYHFNVKRAIALLDDEDLKTISDLVIRSDHQIHVTEFMNMLRSLINTSKYDDVERIDQLRFNIDTNVPKQGSRRRVIDLSGESPRRVIRQAITATEAVIKEILPQSAANDRDLVGRIFDTLNGQDFENEQALEQAVIRAYTSLRVGPSRGSNRSIIIGAIIIFLALFLWPAVSMAQTILPTAILHHVTTVQPGDVIQVQDNKENIIQEPLNEKKLQLKKGLIEQGTFLHSNLRRASWHNLLTDDQLRQNDEIIELLEIHVISGNFKISPNSNHGHQAWINYDDQSLHFDEEFSNIPKNMWQQVILHEMVHLLKHQLHRHSIFDQWHERAKSERELYESIKRFYAIKLTNEYEAYVHWEMRYSEYLKGQVLGNNESLKLVYISVLAKEYLDEDETKNLINLTKSFGEFKGNTHEEFREWFATVAANPINHDPAQFRDYVESKEENQGLAVFNWLLIMGGTGLSVFLLRLVYIKYLRERIKQWRGPNQTKGHGGILYFIRNMFKTDEGKAWYDTNAWWVEGVFFLAAGFIASTLLYFNLDLTLIESIRAGTILSFSAFWAAHMVDVLLLNWFRPPADRAPPMNIGYSGIIALATIALAFLPIPPLATGLLIVIGSLFVHKEVNLSATKQIEAQRLAEFLIALANEDYGEAINGLNLSGSLDISELSGSQNPGLNRWEELLQDPAFVNLLKRNLADQGYEIDGVTGEILQMISELDAKKAFVLYFDPNTPIVDIKKALREVGPDRSIEVFVSGAVKLGAEFDAYRLTLRNYDGLAVAPQDKRIRSRLILNTIGQKPDDVVIVKPKNYSVDHSGLTRAPTVINFVDLLPLARILSMKHLITVLRKIKTAA